VRNSLLGCLRDAGFDNSRAVTYLHTLFTYVVGFAVVAGHNEVPSEAEAGRIGALPPESFGHLAGAAQEFSRRFSQRSFDAGLALIIAGLRAELAQA
jgi:hypothetical protein